MLSPPSLCLQPDVELDLDTILTEGFPPVAGSIEDLEREERDHQEPGGSHGRQKGRKVSYGIAEGTLGVNSWGMGRAACLLAAHIMAAPSVLQALQLE